MYQANFSVGMLRDDGGQRLTPERQHGRRSFFQPEESALHAFRLFKDVGTYEKTTMFMVPGASSGGWRARFDIVHEPGGCRTRRGGIERQTKYWRVLTTYCKS